MTVTTASPARPPRALAAWLVAAAAAGCALAIGQAASSALGSAPAPVANPFGVGITEPGGGLVGRLAGVQAYLNGRLLGGLAEGGVPALAWLGFAYGIVHAVGPGHGKAVVSGYILATGADLRRGLAASTAAALLQAAVAAGLVLGLSAMLGVGAAGFRSTAAAVETGSFALVAVLGAWLLARKASDVANRLLHAGTPCGPGCGHGHAPPPAGRGAFAGTVVAAGLRPCSGAVLAMAYALSQGAPWTGLGTVLAMAAGTAVATGLVASASVYAKRHALRFASGRGEGTALALGFAEAVCCACVALLGAAMAAGQAGGAASLFGG